MSLVQQILDVVTRIGQEVKTKVSTTDPRLSDSRIANGGNAETVDGQHASYFAPRSSPAFTDNPTAPTQAAEDNSTKLATTAFVKNALAELPTGGSMDTIRNFVLAENITAGDPVILRSDGKIEGVKGLVTFLNTPITADGVVFDSSGIATSSYNNASFEADFDPINGNRFIVAYRQASSPYSGKFVVGTISSGAISFGSIYTFSATQVNCVRVRFDPIVPDRFVIFYSDGNNSGRPSSKIGTLNSSNVPTFGQVNQISSSAGAYYNYSFDFDPFHKDNVLFAYPVGSTLTLVVATISGNTISVGTPLTLQPGVFSKVMFDDLVPGRVAIGYDPFVKVKIFTISGTDISAAGPENTLISVNSGRSSVDKLRDESGKLVASSSVTTSTGSCMVVYSELDANSIATNKSSSTNGGSNFFVCAGPAHQLNQHAFPSVYTYNGVPRCYPLLLNADRTGLSYQASYTPLSSFTRIPIVICDFKTAKHYVAITEEGMAYLGSLSATITNTFENTALGILQESGNANETKPVLLLGGMDQKQSGLIPAQNYYINPTGGLTTTKADGNVLLGRSISETTLQTRPFFY